MNTDHLSAGFKAPKQDSLEGASVCSLGLHSLHYSKLAVPLELHCSPLTPWLSLSTLCLSSCVPAAGCPVLQTLNTSF